MRKLTTPDLFAAVRVITKSGIKEALVPVIKQASEGTLSLENIGIIGTMTVLEVVSDEACESAVYKWLARPFEMTEDEVKALPLDTLTRMLEQLKEENDLKNFFAVLSRLMSKNS